MGKRKERLHDIPNDLMPPAPQDADESADTVMNLSPDEPTTSASAGANVDADSKLLNNERSSLHDDDDTDTDDEDILPIQNVNLIEIGE